MPIALPSPPPDATTSLRGLVNTSAQSFAGRKLFQDGINLTNSVQLAGSAGTTGQVLTSAGIGATPTWQTISTSLTLGAIGASPNANAATYSGGILNLEPANASFGGVVTTGNQTFAGDKTFDGEIIGAKASGLSMAINTDLLVADPVNRTVGIGTATPFALLDITSNNPVYALDGLDINLTFDGSYDPLGGPIYGTNTYVDYGSTTAMSGLIYGHKVEITSNSHHTGDLIAVWAKADSAAAANLAGLYIGINGAVATRGYGIFIENGFPAGTTENYQIFSQGRAPGAGNYFGMAAGTDVFAVNDRNQMMLVTSSVLTPVYLLYVNSTGSDSVHQGAARFDNSYSGVGANYGVKVYATRSSGSNPSEVIGVDAQMSSGHTGTLTEYASFRSLTQGPTNTVTRMAGFLAQAQSTVGATAVNAAFYARAPSGGTLNASFYSDSLADGNFPIYYAGSAGKQFVVQGNGRTGIGTAAPDAMLHVVQPASLQYGAHINPGSGAYTGNKIGLQIDGISGGTTGNYAIYHVGANGNSQFFVHGRTRMYNYDQVQSDFGGGLMITGGESIGVKNANATATVLFGHYAYSDLQGAKDSVDAVYGIVAESHTSHTSGSPTFVIAVQGSNLLYGNGPVGNLIAHQMAQTRISGTSVVTNAFGLRSDDISLGTSSNYGIYISHVGPNFAASPTGTNQAFHYGSTGQHTFNVEGDGSFWNWCEGYDNGSEAYGAGSNVNLFAYVGGGPNSTGPGPNTTNKLAGVQAEPWWWDQDAVTGVYAIGFWAHPRNDGTLTDLISFAAEPVLESGVATNVIGYQVYPVIPNGGAVTNLYGIKIDPITEGTSTNYAILYSVGDTGGSGWKISGKSARMDSWVQDQAHPGISTYIEGMYIGTAHNTNASINDILGGYVDAELFGSNNLTGAASGLLGSVYWNKTGGTVAKASSLIADTFSDSNTGTVTDLIAFESRYTWNSVPTVTNQYGLKLGVVDKGASTNHAIYYGSGEFKVDGAGRSTSAGQTSTEANVYSGQTSITAHAGGGQANAVALTKEYSVVTTVASNNDSVKLPTAALGSHFVVFNEGANSLDVYPATGGAINAAGTNNPINLAAGAWGEFFGISSTAWRQW